MRTLAFIAFTERACMLACELAAKMRERGVDAQVAGPARYAERLGVDAYDSLDAWTAKHFASCDALVFVSAAGIAVRAIAPHVSDKFSDPAVVQIDEAGAFVVPLLSGHVGGANDLARMLADCCGAQVAVSTATDVNGLFAVDEWAHTQGLVICERVLAKDVSAALLEGTSVGFVSDFEIEGDLPRGLIASTTEGCSLGICVSYDETAAPFKRTLHLVPRDVVLGAGCRRGVESAYFARQVLDVLVKARLSVRAVCMLASIDVKQDEIALHDFARTHECELAFFSAEELRAVQGEFSHSSFVEKTVGVGNVCERAAVLASDNGVLICSKQPLDGVTVALARKPRTLCFP